MMKENIQIAIAKGIIDIYGKNDEPIYELKNGKTIEKGLIDKFELINDAIDDGVQLLLPINSSFTGYTCTFMEHLLQLDPSIQMIELISSKLSTDDIHNINEEIVNHCFSYSNNNIKLLERFFELGFNFKQGNFDEINKALEGNIEFFELCLQIKPDFKFSFQYDEGLTLDEILEDDIIYEKSNNLPNLGLQKKESLLAFLKKAKEVELLKNNLNENLPNKSPISAPIKKL